MDFEKGNIYHVFNQGNNRQLIFFSRRNYEYFIKKIRLYILPYADILAWCLMPNHFHLMLFVHDTHRMTLVNTQGMTISHTLSASASVNSVSLNDSIGIMLRSYTRGINKERGRTGSIFRKYTKAVNLTNQNGISPSWYTSNGITQIHIDDPDKSYPQVCFNYIHNNPVHHGFVFRPEEWAFSSYREYRSKSGKVLINKSRADKFGLKLDSEDMT